MFRQNSKPANVSKIIGIQFSILSPEEILKGSVAEITSYRATYINNRPCPRGLFDPCMGVLEPGLICPTDGLDYMQTPGYFGHIVLARPVFYIQYLSTILKILRCVCTKCSKLLINKKLHKSLMELRPDERWSRVYQLASKIRRCGEDTDDGCGWLQPDKKFRKDGLANIFAEWNNAGGGNTSSGSSGSSTGDAGSSAPPATSQQSASSRLNMKVTPEMVIKIFKRISDEDTIFMGFSPQFSRPEWMICQVLAIPPPAVRPSIKLDGQQRSEDDITHIIVNIIRTNDQLREQIKKKPDANPNVINDLHTLLQYYVATQINNNIPGVSPIAQRSGRPLKSIQERLNGKGGRVRGNLMGKRVDFSARSVITPDPNISIRELGIPLKIAKNITKPVVVNDRTRDFLMTLVRNRSDTYPGAKILEKRNGESILLRYADVSMLTLENGDTVHRHMMVGDAILFNRQPSLHRMSMMCHIARIMHKGDTFRMNVGDTKPYNADFDGDEMNLHMPQDAESEVELRHLAAVPYQIISPAKNESIIGIFQDSLLGSYQFTREDIDFTPLQAMGLLVGYPKINVNLFKMNHGERITNFKILSQIMPPLSIRYKTDHFKDNEVYDRSNHVVEIRDGIYLRGQIEKGVLASGGNSLIQRICNDFGNVASADFIDSLQNIITEYMKTAAYSVGISDLISNDDTNQKISHSIMQKKSDVKNIIDQVHLGIFENKTGRSNLDEFENQIANILNTATNDSGKIGLDSLNPNNRFVTIVKCGSKGSNLNISQMISCLGQQSVDGRRIPYGLDGRTLPHFTKFDDSPSARGFIDNSFISGLTPEELFFHAMGGRIGLIDTAVKTSTTGYIQRRLIKGLEDLMVSYDMTVRNNKGRIVQFLYGDDGIDTIKVEKLNVPFLTMTMDELYAHYSFPISASDGAADTGAGSAGGADNAFYSAYTKPAITRMKTQMDELKRYSKRYTESLIRARDDIITHVFRNRDDSKVHLPVGITHLIANVQGMQQINKNSLVDITPLEAFKMIEASFNKLNTLSYSKPTELFKVMFFYYMSPRELLLVKRINKKALTVLLEMIVLQYKRSIVAPGEMVGMIAAQSIGEPTTQLTLNTFHNAGVASKANVTRGVPRIEEILSLSENPKNPSITIYLKPDDELDKERAQELIPFIEHTKLVEIVESVEICYDPDIQSTIVLEDDMLMRQYYEFEKLVDECRGDASVPATSIKQAAQRSKWILRLVLDAESMLDKRITMDDVHYAIKNVYGDTVSCIYSDYNADKLIFRIRMERVIRKAAATEGAGGGAGGGAGAGGGGNGDAFGGGGSKQSSLDQSDHIYILKNFRDQLLNGIVLRGVKGINNVVMRKINGSLRREDGIVKREEGTYVKNTIWVLDTTGTNLMQVLALDTIDTQRTVSNDIQEINRVLGIEAARVAILNELVESFDTTYINHHHLSVLCDRMTANETMVSIFRHGINNDNIGPIAKASFEETPEMFLKAARHAELDNMRGVSANVMCGQEGYYGTSSFQVLVNLRAMANADVPVPDAAAGVGTSGAAVSSPDYADDMFAMVDSAVEGECSAANLVIESVNISGMKVRDLGNSNDDNYNLGF